MQHIYQDVAFGRRFLFVGGERDLKIFKRCRHDYQTKKVIKDYYDSGGNRVWVILMVCQYCGKVKRQKWW